MIWPRMPILPQLRNSVLINSWQSYSIFGKKKELFRHIHKLVHEDLFGPGSVPGKMPGIGGGARKNNTQALPL